MTSETMFAQSHGKLDVRFLKIAIKAMSDLKKISPLVKKGFRSSNKLRNKLQHNWGRLAL